MTTMLRFDETQRQPAFERPEAHASERVDFYGFVHRGLRTAIADAMIRVGAARPHVDDVREVSDRVDAMISLCRTHLEHEDAFIHAAMNRRAPGSAKHTENDHVDHVRDLARLTGLTVLLRRATQLEELRATLKLLYRTLALFLADNLEHMDLEEQHNMRVLWENYSDAELASIERELVGSIAPQSMQAFLRWMLPSVSADERAEFFAKMRLGAPPAVVVGTIEALASYLPEGEAEALLGAVQASSAV